MKNFVIILSVLFSINTFGQYKIQGIIIDAESKEALPFASIKTNTNNITLSDTEGFFQFLNTSNVNILIVSYVGYETKTIKISEEDKHLTIRLKPKIEDLNEVEITAKENPALHYIRQAIENKKHNNIEKALDYFKFNAYNKILVTATPDSISSLIDSVFILKNGERKFHKLDSSNFNFKKEVEDKHLYLSEKISTYKFQKGKKRKEVVLASRMAGLKQPLYELFAITFQDFTFYNDVYTLAGTKYTNPISKKGLKEYTYKILDTLENSASNYSIVIHFKPKKKNVVLGIEGVLFIDNKTFAFTKVIAELKGFINVKAVQNYKYFAANKIWIPSTQNVTVQKGETKENVALFGGIVKFNENKPTDSIQKSAKNNPSDFIYFLSETTNSNFQINTPLKVKRGSSTLQFNEDAASKPEDFWNKYRTDSLTKRGVTTYKHIDSVAQSEGVERKINLARNILKGYYPTKYLNLDIGKTFNLNNHEGFRIGFGGLTNSNFSKKVKIEAYGAYGTKDKEFKYSFGAATRLGKGTNTWIGAKYTNDILEAASLKFIAENTSFSLVNPRNLNIDKFYNYKTTSAFLYYNIQPNLEAKMMFSSGKYETLFDYSFISPTKNITAFNLSSAVIGFNFLPNSEFMNTPLGKITVKNAYPQINLQYTQAFGDVLKSNFAFGKINLRIQHKIKRLRRSTTSFLLESGIVLGETPITHLYNATPNYTYKNPWARRITFAGKNSFETMVFNEFLSDKYVALHLKHQFKFFNISKSFKPQLTIVTRGAVGNIDNPQYHHQITFKKMNKGYFESGLELNHLLKGFGLSAFYRYGAYYNKEWSDNLAAKITYNIRLGF